VQDGTDSSKLPQSSLNDPGFVELDAAQKQGTPASAPQSSHHEPPPPVNALPLNVKYPVTWLDGSNSHVDPTGPGYSLIGTVMNNAYCPTVSIRRPELSTELVVVRAPAGQLPQLFLGRAERCPKVSGAGGDCFRCCSGIRQGRTSRATLPSIAGVPVAAYCATGQ
jgi:hypothetical protein